MNSIKEIGTILLIFIGNLIGCALVFIAPGGQFVVSLAAAKLAAPLWLVFIKAIVCGVLIYAAVD